MNTILISDFSNEAASKTNGLVLKELLDTLLTSQEADIVVDFSGVSRFASPFFNYSFAALALIHGFDAIRSIRLKNIGQVGLDTYNTSMTNAEQVSLHPEHIAEINQIIDNTPKKVTL